MPKFNITVSRTAYENIVLEVEAGNQDEVEKKINAVLDSTRRATIDDLISLPGIRYLTTDLNGDKESSWEIIDCEETP